MNGDVDPAENPTKNFDGEGEQFTTENCKEAATTENHIEHAAISVTTTIAVKDKCLATEIASLRMELEKQQENIGDIVQSYDSEVNRLNERLKQYEDEDLEKSAKKRKRTSEEDRIESSTVCEDIHSLKEEMHTLSKAMKEKNRNIDILHQRNKSLTELLNERETELEKVLEKINEESRDELQDQIRRLDDERTSNGAYIDHLKELTEKQETELEASKEFTSKLNEEL